MAIIYEGVRLFGTENFGKDPIAYINSDTGIDRHDNGEFVQFSECPSCGMDNLSRLVCQFCGQRFIKPGCEKGDNV